MNFELYYQPDVPIRWFDGAQSLLFPQGPETLLVFTDDGLPDSPVAQAFLAPLLEGAEPVNLEGVDIAGASFDLYRWSSRATLEQQLSQVESARAWASAETVYSPDRAPDQQTALHFPLRFGNRLSMLGYQYHRQGDELNVVTYWRVLDNETNPLAIFVHVLDPDNTVRAGWDGLYVSTDGWQPGDVFVHLHALSLPPDLIAATGRIEIGVYSPTTLERLPLFVSRDDETAPYDRALLSPLPDLFP
jgi:hypothetical protein